MKIHLIGICGVIRQPEASSGWLKLRGRMPSPFNPQQDIISKAKKS